MLPGINYFGVYISSYILTGSIGFFAMWLAASLATRGRGEINRTQILHVCLAAMGGLFIGAHLLYGVVSFRIFLNAARDHFSLLHSPLDWINFFALIFGGMVFYGGLFGAIVGAAWYMKALKLPYRPYFDVMAFCIPLFHGFARIGCFLGGCCYGVEWKYGITFHHALEKSANGVPRFPVQLLESGLEFVLFAVLLVLYRKKKLSGRLLYVYLLAYSVIRFFDEFLRGDKIRGFVGVLSTSQFISVLLFAGVIILLVVRAVRKNDSDGEHISSSDGKMSTEK